MKISVITVTFNAAAVLERTVQSVLGQTFPQVEYVVIDGASADGTLAILERYRDSIALLRSEPDRGIYDAMNKAIGLATGDYLLFMNAGDVFAGPDSLMHLAAAASTVPGEQVIFGGWADDRGAADLRPHRPDLARGLFNHQATLYSRSLHAWHGRYLTIPGLSTADFVFFRTLQKIPGVTWALCPEETAIIDPYGLSSGLQTYFQRVLVDLLCGYESRRKGLLKIIVHPAYHRLKRLFGRVR